MTMEEVIFVGLDGRLSRMTKKERGFSLSLQKQWSRGLSVGQERYARSLLRRLSATDGPLIDCEDSL